MTSKEKLIEFLKSANIGYDKYNHKEGCWIEVASTIYFFDLQGNYLRQEDY